MGKHLAFQAVLGVIVASCLSLGAFTATAQPPAPASAATPAATPSPAPTATPAPVAAPSKPSKATGKASAQPSRKYERSYKHCKMRALRRGLKGVERRAFIRRCELGFAPPRVRVAPDTQPMIIPDGTTPAMPTPTTTTPAPVAPPARK